MKAFADATITFYQVRDFVFESVENIEGKGYNVGYHFTVKLSILTIFLLLVDMGLCLTLSHTSPGFYVSAVHVF